MAERLPEEEVARIAGLARLKLTAEERSALAGQLAQILAFAAQVAGLDTSRVAPADDWLGQPPVERPDEVRPSLGEALALSNAPEQAATLFLTPRVLPRS
ncbi:MAG: gatC [Acidobacteria bacterium]|nr:gatC [Acidobacteriota bacterium]